MPSTAGTETHILIRSKNCGVGAAAPFCCCCSLCRRRDVARVCCFCFYFFNGQRSPPAANDAHDGVSGVGRASQGEWCAAGRGRKEQAAD
jgi:hypothetical protein